MQLIHYNPFRILALPFTATERQIAKRISDLKAYASIGKVMSYDLDFPFLPTIERTEGTIRDAMSQIEQPQNRLFHSLFWFWDHDDTDQTAFASLQAGDLKRGVELWAESIEDDHVTQANLSHAKNLAVLYLALAANELLPRLSFVEGPCEFGEHQIPAGATTIGRDEHADFSIDDPGVSRKHAQIACESGTWMLSDLGSSNGTFVNDEQIASTSIKGGDIISVGYTILRFEDKRLTSDSLSSGMYWVGKLFSSDLYQQYKHDITGARHQADDAAVMERFIDEVKRLVLPALNQANGLTVADFMHSFETFPVRARQYLSEGFTAKHLRKVEDELDAIRAHRQRNPAEAYRLACKLHERACPELEALQKLLPSDDIQVQVMSDRVAEEIVQCSIVYFNKLQSTSENPTENTLSLLKMAESVAKGGRIQLRIKESLKTVREQGKARKIEAQVKYIVTLLNESPDPNGLTLGETMKLCQRADHMAKASEPMLSEIKNVLGPGDDFYLNLSSAVAGKIINMCVVFLNHTQRFAEAAGVLSRVGHFDMNAQVREYFDRNVLLLKQAGLLMPASPRVRGAPATKATKEVSCYVATMAYGDANAPEVVELRKFRDRVLRKQWLGRAFITMYYRTSPWFVRNVSQSTFVKQLSRAILDPFVRWVSR